MLGRSIKWIMLRNWGALIFLAGAMLIYGAFNAAARPLVLLGAAASKIVFIALVLSNRDRFLRAQAGVSIAHRLPNGRRVRRLPGIGD